MQYVAAFVAVAIVPTLILKFFWIIMAVLAVIIVVKVVQAKEKNRLRAVEAHEKEVFERRNRIRKLEISNGVAVPTTAEVAQGELDAVMVRLEALRVAGTLSTGEFSTRKDAAVRQYLRDAVEMDG
jgi:hypothetical protein